MGQLYTTYWIVVVWRRDRGHLLILIVINLLLLWALNRVKVRIKFFWCVTWPLDRCFTWLCGWALFILNHQSTEFGIHRSCESGVITSLMCHMTTWFVCHVTLWIIDFMDYRIIKHYNSTFTLWKWNYNVFYLSRDHDIEVSRGFVGGVLSV